jgi:hypothetical protein
MEFHRSNITIVDDRADVDLSGEKMCFLLAMTAYLQKFRRYIS